MYTTFLVKIRGFNLNADKVRVRMNVSPVSNTEKKAENTR